MIYPDIYMMPEYVKLFEVPDRGTSSCFHYVSDFGEVCYSFILRPITINGKSTGYSDIISPYGYGGPVIIKCLSGNNAHLIKSYHEEFGHYCQRHNIVSEFVRFHPLLNNIEYCKNIYDATFNRKTVAINMTLDDLMHNCFTQKCRNTIRKAIKNDVTAQFDFTGTSVPGFYRLYTMTMQKHVAPGYYFFSEDFFVETMRALNGRIFILNAVYRGEIVSSAMFMHHQDFMHYHFSATHPDYYKLACNNLIISEAAQWGKDHGKQLFHLGGGFTTAGDDPLFLFKKSFAKDGLCDFWIGRRVHNHNIYRELVEIVQNNKDEPLNRDYFPLYRA